jgi:hypothetical protein
LALYEYGSALECRYTFIAANRIKSKNLEIKILAALRLNMALGPLEMEREFGRIDFS